MKKFILILAFCLGLAPVAKSDSSFLSALEFSYIYDYPIFQDCRDNGIDPDAFGVFLVDPNNSLGEKVAMIESLATYCEFALFQKMADEEQEGYDEYAEQYFYQRVDAFRIMATALQEGDEEPAEVSFLYTLLSEYNTYSPDPSLFDEAVNMMPNSLTVQSVQMIAKGYAILYNGEGNDEEVLKDYKRDLCNYFINVNSFDADAVDGVRERVFSWTLYIDGMEGTENIEQLLERCGSPSKKAPKAKGSAVYR